MSNIKKISIALIILAASVSVIKQPPTLTASDSSLQGWKLVWSDEFNKDGKPDTNNWTYESGFVRNNELQWYQPDNARCENGLLIIEGRREKKRNPRYDPNSKDWKRNRQFAEYTSSSLLTRGIHSWQYGRFVMRGKIDTRDGLWPAFWTLGVKGGWPAGGEIDIMEYYNGLLLANVAWQADNSRVPKWNDVRKPLSDFNDPDWSKKFHVWRMDWDANKIELYVDDKLLNRTDVNDTISSNVNNPIPFRQPHYIILNLAIGGNSGGDPSKTDFPARFEVDYVRIYQKS